MKSLIQKSFLILILILFGCLKNTSPLEPNDYIDPMIVGDWIQVTERDVVGRPNTSVYGQKIYDDGYITKLGIETASGELKELYGKSERCSRIKYANNGRMEIEVPPSGLAPGHISIRKYEVSDSTLTFILENADGEQFGEAIYIKSVLDDKIQNPLNSKCSTIIDSDTIQNLQVWKHPSAYFGYGYSFEYDSLVCEIYSWFSNNREIRIQLPKFDGIGMYILGAGNDGVAVYSEYIGCAIPVYFTEEPNLGFVRIDEYDLQKNTCSGVFEFSLSHTQIEFKEGRFEIPIYH